MQTQIPTAIPGTLYQLQEVLRDRPRLFYRPNRKRINRGLSPIVHDPGIGPTAFADSNHPFFCIAVNRITSNAIKTIQPYGYGKAPVKKAHNVAMSNTIKSPEIQSGLISASPVRRNVDYGNSTPVRLIGTIGDRPQFFRTNKGSRPLYRPLKETGENASFQPPHQ
jgi:hypothetical protein